MASKADFNSSAWLKALHEYTFECLYEEDCQDGDPRVMGIYNDDGNLHVHDDFTNQGKPLSIPEIIELTQRSLPRYTKADAETILPALDFLAQKLNNTKEAISSITDLGNRIRETFKLLPANLIESIKEDLNNLTTLSQQFSDDKIKSFLMLIIENHREVFSTLSQQSQLCDKLLKHQSNYIKMILSACSDEKESSNRLNDFALIVIDTLHHELNIKLKDLNRYIKHYKVKTHVDPQSIILTSIDDFTQKFVALDKEYKSQKSAKLHENQQAQEPRQPIEMATDLLKLEKLIVSSEDYVTSSIPYFVRMNGGDKVLNIAPYYPDTIASLTPLLQDLYSRKIDLDLFKSRADIIAKETSFL